MQDVKNDSLGYAGTEVIRRTVGDSKVLEITEIKDKVLKEEVMKTLVNIGINLIMNRGIYQSGSEIIDDIDQIIGQTLISRGEKK
ncbi:hypothetical protein [Lactobacillus acetotolerans]|uniref:hypothetical protein n=1 Tax=Lactobacillus acetotolerans TaxID=1600 RepID=UPI0014517903|nr:hypothetical protein [Lactobacillus acetotolerans]QJD72939.1 hypothetical protein HG715_02870 [Lactobacillus acetotolerans]